MDVSHVYLPAAVTVGMQEACCVFWWWKQLSLNMSKLMFYTQSPTEYEWFTSFNTTQPRDRFPVWPHHNMTGRHWNKQRQHILKLADILVTSKLADIIGYKQKHHICDFAFVVILTGRHWNKQTKAVHSKTGKHHWLQANWLTSLVTSKSITLVTTFVVIWTDSWQPA